MSRSSVEVEFKPSTSCNVSRGESLLVEYKQQCDLKDARARCEILKDIAAIANSGDGVLRFGVDSMGAPTPTATGAAAPDVAKIVNQLQSYSDGVIPNMTVVPRNDLADGVWDLSIKGSTYPLVFTRDGTYDSADKKGTGYAFRLGTVYVRRSGISCPATSADLRTMLDRLLGHRLSQVRQVIEAPLDARVVVQVGPTTGAVGVQELRLTDNPATPEFHINDHEITKLFPYTYKELTSLLREHIPGFLENHQYHKARRAIEAIPSMCHMRCLMPGKPSSGHKKLYSQAAADRLVLQLTGKSPGDLPMDAMGG